ncbi:hypothetical protein [Helicobacter sp.]|uniref:hypothetical protein n=1 Tax=Helicobacter sp. TaxID=218 RepID=UPI0025B842B2|nr:hypothetical protein [Helicobacter sp.]MCI5969444.1 hypothetical protein [Helicobacter sp.]MDY2584235.1 hypothetical protein [Helicobacter sp.]
MLISLKFLKSIYLKFVPNIVYEDGILGMLLFLQAKTIYVLPKKLYRYRYREGSWSVHNDKDPTPIIPKVFQGVVKSLKNPYLARQVHNTMSWMTICWILKDFMEKKPNFPNLDLFKETLMPFFYNYLNFIYFLQSFQTDIGIEEYFTICFNVVFEILKKIPNKGIFDDLQNPSVIKSKERARQIQFVKDLLYLENSHIVRLNQENQALQNALTQAQERIKMLESKFNFPR